MSNLDKYYINGEWVVPLSKTKMNVINPANEDSIGEIILANELDVNLAVAAAKSAFSSFSQTSKEERLKLLKALLEISKKRLPELAKVISLEMGAPMTMSLELQADAEVVVDDTVVVDEQIPHITGQLSRVRSLQFWHQCSF